MPEVAPELGALAAVGALLIIAGALWVLQGLIRNSLGRLPLVGGWINSNIDAALNDARNAVLSASGATWGVAVQLFRWMQAWFRNPISETIRTFAEVYSFGRRLYDVTLPALEVRVLATASGLASSAIAHADGLYNAAVSYVTASIASALAQAASWVTAAENYATRLFDTAALDITSGIARAESDAASALNAATSALGANITAAEQLAAREVTALEASTQTAVNQLASNLAAGLATAEALAASNLAALQHGIITDLEQTGDAAIGLAWPGAAGDIQALRGALGADFPWLNDLTGLLAGAGTAGLLGALIRSLAASQAVTRLATDCIVPNCRNLSGLGQFLQSLFADATDVALFAWLAEAVADPQRWAADTDALLGSIATDTASAARTLLGV